MIKNVVIVSDVSSIAHGAADVAINTAALLAEKGLKVYFFAGTGEKTDSVDEKLKSSPNIKVISLGLTLTRKNPNVLMAAFQGFYNFQAGKAMRNLLKTLDASETVVHVHSWNSILTSSVLNSVIDLKFPWLFTVHDYMFSCPNITLFNYCRNSICEIPPMSLKCIITNCDKRHYYHKIWRVIRQYMQNRIISRASRTSGVGYIFISEFSRHQLLRRMKPPKNQFFVPNPINYGNRFRIEAENNSVFLFMGRLSEEKGIRNFCEAIHNTKVKGVVIGDGILKDELEAKYPEIEFTGWLNKEQIHKYIKQARCLVFTSIWYEASPLTPLEVNAYGIPVIASDCSAASDNASFVYHSQKELEDLIIQVNTQDIKQLSIDTFNNFDESSTINYADNLLKVYNTPLMTD